MPTPGGHLTLEERAKVASRYEVWRSVVRVQRWWRSENGVNAKIRPETIKRCHSKLFSRGSVADLPRSGRPVTVRDQNNIEAVENILADCSSKSIRQVARETGLSIYQVHTILKKVLKWRAWKPHLCQALSDDDCQQRMEFGDIMLSWHSEWNELFENILWTDEAVFHVGGFVNRHNCHYWAKEDPNVTSEKLQTRPRLLVWCGMTSDKIVGPFILRCTMNSERYLNMLENDVWPALTTVDRRTLIFMQDGAPAHYALVVREWLDSHFPGKWIGRSGPHKWPARSPDLTPCDFFLWGWLKEQVYAASPKTLDELEERIREVLASVPQDFLQRSVASVPRRLEKLVSKAGAHIEF